MDHDVQALAQLYQKGSVIMPANLGSDTLEALEALRHDHLPDKQRIPLQPDKVCSWSIVH